jgi:hypothetical protein
MQLVCTQSRARYDHGIMKFEAEIRFIKAPSTGKARMIAFLYLKIRNLNIRSRNSSLLVRSTCAQILLCSGGGGRHDRRLGRPVASQCRSRLAEAIGWVRCSWLSPRSVARNSLGLPGEPLVQGGVARLLQRLVEGSRGTGTRPRGTDRRPQCQLQASGEALGR